MVSHLRLACAACHAASDHSFLLNADLFYGCAPGGGDASDQTSAEQGGKDQRLKDGGFEVLHRNKSQGLGGNDQVEDLHQEGDVQPGFLLHAQVAQRYQNGPRDALSNLRTAGGMNLAVLSRQAAEVCASEILDQHQKENIMSRIAIVVSTVGFHWEELFDAYWVFRDAGQTIELYTVNGREPRADPMSLKPTGPGSLFGLGMPASIAPETPRGQILNEELAKVQPLSALNPLQLDALYLPGGHGCLFDVNRDPTLHSIIAQLYEAGVILSAVCHATSTFALTTINGSSIAKGYALTGFPHALDRTLIALGLVRSEFLPLPLINDDELQRGGADHSAFDETMATLNPRHMRVALPFITGMGPKSAAPVAEAVLEQLKAGRSTKPNDLRTKMKA
jgi:putative intracellular protease/amidase